MMKRNRVTIALVMIVTGAVGSEVNGQCQFEVTYIERMWCGPIIPPRPLSAYGLNDLGHVVGLTNDCQGYWDAYVWTAESGLVVLPQPWADERAAALDINASGAIVGYVPASMYGGTEAVAWLDQGLTYLGIPPRFDHSVAHAINDDGAVVGYNNNSNVGPLTAFRWSGGTMETLELPLGPYSVANDINRSGQVTGWMGQAPWAQGSHAFILNGERVLDLGVLPGGFSAEGVAINDAGQVAGNGRRLAPDGRDLYRGFVWTDGAMQEIAPLPGQLETAPSDMNLFGQAVGFSKTRETDADTNHNIAFLWQNGVTHDLNDLVSAPIDGYFSWARAVNDVGQIIVAFTPNSGAWHAALLTPIGRPPGDVDADCRTGLDDLLFIIGHWGEQGGPADADESGMVDVDDLLIVILSWTD